jgi:hypothetical protein
MMDTAESIKIVKPPGLYLQLLTLQRLFTT